MMPWSHLRVLALVAVAFSVSGCGVMFGGTTETLRVSSSPAAARLTTEPATGTFTTRPPSRSNGRTRMC